MSPPYLSNQHWDWVLKCYALSLSLCPEKNKSGGPNNWHGEKEDGHCNLFLLLVHFYLVCSSCKVSICQYPSR